VEQRLATKQFKTSGVDLFVEWLGKIISVSREGQLGIKAVLTDSLARVEYDKRGRAVRLFPMLRRQHAPKSIAIDPGVLSGALSLSERRCRPQTSDLASTQVTRSRSWRAPSSWRPS
jgi:hypothetical protein